MKTQKSEKPSKLKKLLDHYRVAIINEETFEERFHFKASRITALISIFLYSIFISTITYILIAFSPIKEFIPGYPTSKSRMKAITNSIRVDSIINDFEKQKKYFNSIKKHYQVKLILHKFKAKQFKIFHQQTQHYLKLQRRTLC